MSANNPLPIFISYSHQDTEYLNRLLTYLKPLEGMGHIDPWSDRRIQAGQDWEQEIKNALSAAQVAILLVSQDFLASDFIVKKEIPPLFAAANARGVLILSVFVGHSQYDLYPDIAKYQGINDPAHPLCDLNKSEQDKVWLALANRVKAHLTP